MIMTNISCSIKKLFNINIRCRNWKNVFCHLSNYKISFVDLFSQFKRILIIFNRKNKILKIILNFEMKSCFRLWLFNIFKTESFWFIISISCTAMTVQVSMKCQHNNTTELSHWIITLNNYKTKKKHNTNQYYFSHCCQSFKQSHNNFYLSYWNFVYSLIISWH